MPINPMPIRIYDLKDDLMLQRAQVFHDYFVIDQAAFVADFPMFATPYETVFQGKIDAADAQPSGAEIDSQIAVTTNQLNQLLEPARKALQRLYTYADLAWNDPVKTRSLGKGKTYEKARNSQLGMKELLERAYRMVDNDPDKASLIAAG